MDAYKHFEDNIHVPAEWLRLYERDHLRFILRGRIAAYHINICEEEAYPTIHLNPPAKLAKIGFQYWCRRDVEFYNFQGGMLNWGISEDEFARFSPNWRKWIEMGRTETVARHRKYVHLYPNVLVPMMWFAERPRREIVKLVCDHITRYHFNPDSNSAIIVRLNPNGFLHVNEWGYGFLMHQHYREMIEDNYDDEPENEDANNIEAGNDPAEPGNGARDIAEVGDIVDNAGVGDLAGNAGVGHIADDAGEDNLVDNGDIADDAGGEDLADNGDIADDDAGVEENVADDTDSDTSDSSSGISSATTVSHAIHLADKEDDARSDDLVLRRMNQELIDQEEEMHERVRIRANEMDRLAEQFLFYNECMAYVECVKNMEWEE